MMMPFVSQAIWLPLGWDVSTTKSEYVVIIARFIRLIFLRVGAARIIKQLTKSKASGSLTKSNMKAKLALFSAVGL